uniref:Uncharacterized protein n=1 Tax=viral metagenome TaxID=1070528 RepID=A0A6M3IPB7_9ZZZZ
MYKFLDFYIPPRMMGGINRYVNGGVRPGHFLQAVISNDLTQACWRADDENLKNLTAFVAYFYNKTPSGCWGSGEKMERWIRKFEEEL